jgi:hypothetical protein
MVSYRSLSTQAPQSPTVPFSRRLQLQVQLLRRGPNLQFTDNMKMDAKQFPELCFEAFAVGQLSKSRVGAPVAMDQHLC